MKLFLPNSFPKKRRAKNLESFYRFQPKPIVSRLKDNNFRPFRCRQNYEKYEYGSSSATYDDGFKVPYIQADRIINSRKVSADGTGNDILEWKYLVSAPPGNSGNPLDDSTGYRVISIIAPDKTRTEIYKHDPITPGDVTGKQYWAFGFADSRSGMTIQKKFYSTSADGLGGQLYSREITEYEQTNNSYSLTLQCGQNSFTKTINAYRNVRPQKQVGIIFEGSGSALAQTLTFAYDVSNQLTTGVDRTLATTSNFAVVSNTTAQTGTISQITTGSLARSTETVYINDATYRNQNILALPSVVKVKDAAGSIVSQSEMLYDESGYAPVFGRGLPTTSRTWDSTKGLVTNTNAYLLTHAKFDTYGNRIEATDAKGNITTTEYDATYQAFPIKVRTPIADPNPSQNPDGSAHGSATAFESIVAYDYTTGLPTATTDANGQTTTIEYNDLLLRPTKTTAPNGRQTITEYGAGTSATTRYVKVRTQLDAAKWKEGYSWYDGLGRTIKTQAVDSQGDVFSETQYDSVGRVWKASNPYRLAETPVWTTNIYDEASRIKETDLPDGAKVITDYGISVTGTIGVTKQITDQAGKKRKGITDALGRMIRVIEDPDGQNLNTDYVFDTLGNLRKTTQDVQNRYFMYDSLGRLLYAKQPEQEANTAFVATDAITNNTQWSVKYVYDDNGNITQTTDARGISVTGTYDKFNRLINRDYSDPATPDVSFFYDGTGLGLGSIPDTFKGKMTKVSSSVSETRYTSFDNLGRLLASEQRTPFSDTETIATATPRTSYYQYNLSGQLTQQTYPSGRVVINEFDADGALSRVAGNAAGQIEKTYANSFSYNSAGAVESLKLGNGKWESAKYNNRLQVKEMGLGNSATDTSLLKLSFGYGTATENNSSMRSQTITVPNVGGNAGFTATQSYAYDNLNRLQSATETIGGGQTWKQTFSYDRFGNRSFDAANTTTLGSCSQSVCNPLINTSDNRFSANQGYGYDKDGNVILDAENQRFVYDAESKQTQFFKGTNNTQTPDATYLYDGEGKRVKKISYQETTVFVYDGGGQLVADYSTQISATPQTSYLTEDHLGSPRIISNQLGAVTSRKDFGAFGDETLTSQRTSSLGYDPLNAKNQPEDVRQDYTGYQKNEESRLEYAQTRYYNSSHGRFTSVDPLTASASIEDPQTFNHYSLILFI